MEQLEIEELETVNVSEWNWPDFGSVLLLLPIHQIEWLTSLVQSLQTKLWISTEGNEEVPAL